MGALDELALHDAAVVLALLAHLRADAGVGVVEREKASVKTHAAHLCMKETCWGREARRQEQHSYTVLRACQLLANNCKTKWIVVESDRRQ
jgi:hypothetical protein